MAWIDRQFETVLARLCAALGELQRGGQSSPPKAQTSEWGKWGYRYVKPSVKASKPLETLFLLCVNIDV